MDFVFESVTSRALGLQSIGGTEVDANPSEQGVKRLVREAVPRLELRRIHAVEVVAPGKRVLVHMVGSALLRGERVDHRLVRVTTDLDFRTFDNRVIISGLQWV